jgi:beta-glucosidase
MPGPTRWRGTIGDLAVSSRKVTPTTIDERARNVLEFVRRASEVPVSNVEGKRDLPEDRALNRKLAADSLVLLRNDAGVLPLPNDIKEIALIGPSLKNVAFCGGGSASLEPYYTVSPYQGIVNQLGKDAKVQYEVGAYAHGYLPTLSPSDWQAADGQPGGRVRFFREPPSVSDREIIDETIISESVWQLMGFQHDRLNGLFYGDIEGSFTAPATGAFEFGLAVYGSANLYIDGRLIIENTTLQNSGSFFFGKGTIEEKSTVDLVEGQVYNIKIQFGSAPSSKLVKPGVVNFGGGAGRLGIVQVLDEDEAIRRAVGLAKNNKYTILCAGLTVSLRFQCVAAADSTCCNRKTGKVKAMIGRIWTSLALFPNSSLPFSPPTRILSL